MVTTTKDLKGEGEGNDSACHLKICSLDELQIKLNPNVKQYLARQYTNNNDDNGNEKDDEFEQILTAMKLPPRTTVCRVNQILSTADEVIGELQTYLSKNYNYSSSSSSSKDGDKTKMVVEKDPNFDDVVLIRPKQTISDNMYEQEKVVGDDDKSESNSLFSSRVPTNKLPNVDNTKEETKLNTSIFQNWPSRKQRGWPMTHRVVVCDQFCGEAVLRGSNIFVRGILAADTGIRKDEIVAVYAHIRDMNDVDDRTICRGTTLENCLTGTAVFLGLGQAACSRSEFFSLTKGIGIVMSQMPYDRAGPTLPPLSGALEDKMMLQNLPSILVGHVLNPQPNEVILDMCCAPGGKSSHLASLVNNQALIVCCDSSRKRMVSARDLFRRLGATCIVPLSLDSTKCVEPIKNDQLQNMKSVKEILDDAPINEKTGLKHVKRFYPESFDRILLDPPCSALGLRPKLSIVQSSVDELQKHANYQRKFVNQAIKLLKGGGFMTYSTCTINASENEGMVRHILDHYPCMELLPIQRTAMATTTTTTTTHNDSLSAESLLPGRPGLSGQGLDDTERMKVRRFDPHCTDADTMGFFVALFRKKTQQEQQGQEERATQHQQQQKIVKKQRI